MHNIGMVAIRLFLNLILFPHELAHYGVARLLGMEAELHLTFVRIKRPARHSKWKRIAVALAPAVLGLLLLLYVGWFYQFPSWFILIYCVCWLLPCGRDFANTRRYYRLAG